MRRIPALLAFVCISAPAMAAPLPSHPEKIALGAGVDEGGMVLGADFIVGDTSTESYGAYARIYSKDAHRGAPAIFAVGGSVRGQFKSGIIEYYLSPGFGLIHHNLAETELLFGPSLAYGMSAELNREVELGIENSKLYSWIGEYRGLIKDTFLAQIRIKI